MSSSYIYLASVLSISLILMFIGWHFYRSQKYYNKKVLAILEAVGLPSFRQSLPQFKKELSRVRRHQRPLSVMVIKPNKNYQDKVIKAINNPKENSEELTSEFLSQISQIEFLVLGLVLRDTLRETDFVTYDGRTNQFIVGMPESTKDEVIQTLERIQKLTGQKFQDKIEVGITEFPVDGLIIDDLIRLAMENCNHKFLAEIVKN